MRAACIPASLCTALLAAGFAAHLSAQPATPVYSFEVIHSFPHDPEAFTQGLEFHDGFLYEGTGLAGQSSLRKVRLETGEVERRIDIPPEFFGEGITVVGTTIVQITWQSKTGFVYDLRDFHLLRRFSYPGEGWGLASNGSEVFMSDGTPTIRVLDPGTLAEKRRFEVRDRAAPVAMLNELEWVDGEIYANVWQTDRIARISPRTGEVTGWIDLTGLRNSTDRSGSGDVLNGIAWDAGGKRLFVTGKLWPDIFEIRLAKR